MITGLRFGDIYGTWFYLRLVTRQLLNTAVPSVLFRISDLSIFRLVAFYIEFPCHCEVTFLVIWFCHCYGRQKSSSWLHVIISTLEKGPWQSNGEHRAVLTGRSRLRSCFRRQLFQLAALSRSPFPSRKIIYLVVSLAKEVRKNDNEWFRRSVLCAITTLCGGFIVNGSARYFRVLAKYWSS